jgi:tetratricopeptide repeat protein 21B
MDIQEPEEAI